MTLMNFKVPEVLKYDIAMTEGLKSVGFARASKTSDTDPTEDFREKKRRHFKMSYDYKSTFKNTLTKSSGSYGLLLPKELAD